jgi:ferredoxin-NADP reductase
MQYKEKIKAIDWLAHNVIQLEVPKPTEFEFNVGDAVEIKVNNQEPGPFTITNLPGEGRLEFVIRVYAEHHGKTEALSRLKPGDEISFTEPFNTFQPQKRAVFLAGGTGITPFISIMRYMQKQDTLTDCFLFFSNKTRKDLFLEEELTDMLGDHFQNIIANDKDDPDYYGNIDEAWLKAHIDDLSRPVLVCGPPAFNEAMEKALKSIGVKEGLIDLGS